MLVLEGHPVPVPPISHSSFLQAAAGAFLKPPGKKRKGGTEGGKGKKKEKS